MRTEKQRDRTGDIVPCLSILFGYDILREDYRNGGPYMKSSTIKIIGIIIGTAIAIAGIIAGMIVLTDKNDIDYLD